jgi:molybdopterin-guanine dinucleotide biosynthesis protein A
MQQRSARGVATLHLNDGLYHEDMAEPSRNVAALLLTGGKSRRMGRDKSQLIVEGSTLAVRTAKLLLLVVDLALEVGPGVSGLPVVVEHSPGEGPLGALADGCRALRELGHTGGALAIACDLPLLSEAVLRLLVEWDSLGSVVPLVQGRPQPLCAKWGAHDLDDASRLVAQGVRSLQHLTRQPDVVLLDESAWRLVASEEQFFDVDTPDDLQRLGLKMQ